MFNTFSVDQYFDFIVVNATFYILYKMMEV